MAEDEGRGSADSAYGGLRWGEAIGLEREYARPGEIYVEWQLREVGNVFSAGVRKVATKAKTPRPARTAKS